MTYTITYEVGGTTETHEFVGSTAIIGRGPGSEVLVPEPSISRYHAKLVRSGHECWIVDLGSRNGVLIDGVRHDEHSLKPGDSFQLGEIVFTLGTSFPTEQNRETEEDLGRTVFRRTSDFATLASTSTLQVPQQLSDLARLRNLLELVTSSSRALLSTQDLDSKLKTVLDLAFDHLPAERGFVMLPDASDELVIRCERNRETGSRIAFSQTIASKVYRENVAVLISDAQNDSRFATESVVALKIRSAMAAPLFDGVRSLGLIYIDSSSMARAFDESDLDLLSALANHAAIAIQQSRLQGQIVEQTLLRQRLERYHSPAVVERIAQSRERDELVADERNVTILFADIVGFTSRCEAMDPKSVARLLNHYLSVMADVVFEHGGTLDKFIGDCIMAVFGAPFPSREHACHAVDAALDMQTAVKAMNKGVSKEFPLEIRAGLHSGRVIAGDIGSKSRRDFTVLGAVVNLASRLEGVALPGQVVASGEVCEAIGPDYRTRFLGDFELKGIIRPVQVYEVAGRSQDRGLTA